MLTFLLSGISFLGMIHTHQNLNHLTINSMTTKPVFAGQIAQFPLSLSSNNNKEHFNIIFQAQSSKEVSTSISTDSLEPIIEIPHITNKRGILNLGRVKVFTEFPLGLFHAWSWIELDTHCLVYPVPEKHPPVLNFTTGNTNGSSDLLSGNDDFAGIRDYQKGDSSSLLAWKAIARSGKLQSKLLYTESGNEIWLNWNDLPANIDTEQRLSILCRWILDCHHNDISYGIDIPGKKILPASGLHHKHDALRVLALYGQNRK